MKVEIRDTKFERVLRIVSLFGISLTLAAFTFLFLKVDELSRRLQALGPGQSISVGCGQDCQDQIRAVVSEAMATISALPKPTPIFSTPISAPASTFTNPVYKTIYIPLGTSGSTQNTDWTTVDGTGAYVDAKNEYGPNVNIYWEAFLSVAYSNGQTFARLWDDTHKIAVDGSEISITANSTPTLVSSGKLNFWAGKNLYKVQIKSLNSFAASYSEGRIKINF